MKLEYIDRLIEIGKTGFCELEDLVYFLPNYPSFNYSEPIFQRNKSEVKNLSREKQICFIKGLHIVEMAYSEPRGADFRFGSPSSTCELLTILDLDSRIKLYNWIAFNGGNFFIAANISYDQNERYKQDKIEKERQKHNEAVINRNKRRELRIETHNQRYIENNALRTELIDELKTLNKLQQLKAILASERSLDYFPEEFSEMTKDIIFELNNDERKVLMQKLKGIKEYSFWQKLKLNMPNWMA